MAMPDFWHQSGYHLLDRTADGHLVATDAFLVAYLERPEIRPVAESCHSELTLHRDLSENPLIDVSPGRLGTLADPDARDNYAVFLRFRDELLARPTLEAFYLDAARGRIEGVPPLFIDHVVQVIVRGMLEGSNDGLRARAAELLFRPQRVTVEDGRILMADDETVEMMAARGEAGPGALQSTAAPRQVTLDILEPERADTYWSRSDAYDLVFDAALTRYGQDALARVLEAWVRHFIDAEVRIQPVASIRDERWRWHIGLDAEATAILNDLWAESEVAEDRLYRLLALFRLEFKAPAAVLPEMTGRPVYLGMAMAADNRLRLKPQNLLVNLPVMAPA
jgi:hypothetical protein